MLTKDTFTTRIPDLVGLLTRLVESESPSHEKAAVDRMAALVAGEMHKLGAQIEILPQPEVGDQVLARWQGSPASGQILLLFHMDTVYPLGTLAERPVRREGDLLYGPGALDMKAGIAVFAGAIAYLQESRSMPDRPIAALFTTDEETGSHASRPVIERLAKESALVLCMEPAAPDGSLKTWRKGVGGYRVTARGKAAHAGADHSKGVNAIEELALHIPAIQRLTNYELGTTLNVGVIQGGTASNVVPETASMVVDLRIMDPEEARRVDEFMRALKPALEGASLGVSGGINRPPMPRDATMQAAFEKARRIAAGIGLELTESGTGGGSDANFVAPLGVPVLDGLGASGEGMHSDHEFIHIPSLAERAALVAALLSEW